jgi:hypothetical protein
MVGVLRSSGFSTDCWQAAVLDEAAPEVEDAPLAEFALGGTRVLGVGQPGEVQGALPSLRR